MVDCAAWIKNFPKSCWFKSNENCKNTFTKDGFHFALVLQLLTTNKFKNVYDALYEYVLFNIKHNFISMCYHFKELQQERFEIIDNKMNYILNDWNKRKIYQNNSYIRCSIKSHISHIFADLFTSNIKHILKKH